MIHAMNRLLMLSFLARQAVSFKNMRVKRVEMLSRSVAWKRMGPRIQVYRLWTDRSPEAAVILFGLETLFTRVSRARSSVIPSLSQPRAAIGFYSSQTS
jgi:hypothetical protein